MKTSLLKYNLMLVALLACVQVFSQHKNTKHEAAKDTTHNKAPQTPVLSANGNCQGGATLVKVEFPLSDSTAMPDYVLFYNIPVPQTYTDSATYNELILFKTLDYKELQANNFILATENAGAFCAKSMRQTSTGLVYSTYSNIVKTRQCSLVTFPDSFNKNQLAEFKPVALKNVQVVEFYIFDRAGIEVYSGKTNNISWNGNYTNQQPCPAGVYYYHCEYIDLASEGEKKSLSGMIELIR